MGDFSRFSMRVAAKPHRCLFCGSEIAPGTQHMSVVSFDMGRFNGGRLHDECWRAEHHLRVVLCDDDGDEMVSISDTEDEDLDVLAQAVPTFRPHAERILAARAERRAA